MNILQKIEAEVMKALQAVQTLFTSGKAQAAIAEAGGFVTMALPIVQEIDALCPNQTVEQVIAAYQKYGVTFVQQSGTNVGNAMLNLATTLLQKNLPTAKAGTAVNILNTAVQLAVTAAHAG